jgi:small-conductance mechanosensitive channel
LRDLETRGRLDEAKWKNQTQAVRAMQSELKELRRRQVEVENRIKDQHTQIRGREAKCKELVKVIKTHRGEQKANCPGRNNDLSQRLQTEMMEQRLIMAYKEVEGKKLDK